MPLMGTDLGGVPAVAGRLVGREAELSAVTAALRHAGTRLLTVTGPPGVGKSRLALAAAEQLRASFGDGVCFIDMADAGGLDAAATAICRAIGVPSGSARWDVPRLAAQLRGRRMLLLVDNALGLVASAPGLADLLASAPGVQVLANSRTPFDLRVERVVRLRPLGLPPDDPAVEVDAVGAAPAVQLFVELARLRDPAFSLTADNARAVAGICRRLDGLPLALELAAELVPALSPSAILDRLAAPLTLRSSLRDVPPWHRSLRDALARSYHALSVDHQRLFLELGAIDGSFSAEDVHVPGPEPTVAEQAGTPAGGLEALLDLVARGLLESAPSPNGLPRFRMIEPLRALAAELRAEARRGDGARAVADTDVGPDGTADAEAPVATDGTGHDEARQQQPMLTDRERSVLRLVTEGLVGKQIARALQISERTVKGDVSSAMAKLGAQNRTQAAVLATELGLVDPFLAGPTPPRRVAWPIRLAT